MSVEKLIRDYFKNINKENIKEVLELFAEEAELSIPGRSVYRGKEAIGDFYKKIFDAKYHFNIPILLIRSGNLVAVEIKAGLRIKNGAEIEFIATDIFEFERGKIRKLTVFYDNYEIMKNLGILTRKEKSLQFSLGVS